MVAYKEAIILIYRDISNKNVKAVRNGAHGLCTHNLEQGLAPFPAVNLQFSENLTNKTINFDYNKNILDFLVQRFMAYVSTPSACSPTQCTSGSTLQIHLQRKRKRERAP